MNLKEWHRHYLESLKKIYAPGEASAITRLLFREMFKISTSDLICQAEKNMTAEEREKMQETLQDLLTGEPVQYVIGHTFFCGLQFLVGKGALIPRPETEILVHLAMDDAKKMGAKKIIDIGTGSGCIAISTKKNLPNAEVYACDVSSLALDWAKKNTQLHSVEIHFLQLDFLIGASRNLLPTFDLILSNPPYIPLQELETLDKNVKEFEPASALFVPDDQPLIFYEAIADFGILHLHADGVIWMETHCDFGENVRSLFEKKGYESRLQQDEFGKNRYVRAVIQSR